VLSKYTAVIRVGLLTSLLGVLTACSGNSNLEKAFEADPSLQRSPTASPSPSASPKSTSQQTLPGAFPREIPQYQNAEFVSAEAGLTDDKGTTRWQSSDPANAIAAYYQQQLQSNNWQIVQPFTADGSDAGNTLIARQKDLEVRISIAPASPNTQFAIAYQRNNANNANNAPSPTPTATTAPTQIASDSPLKFNDIANLSDPLKGYVQDLAALGVLVGNNNQNNQFNPDQVITRREYARWLVAANNKLYANQPNKQIRLAGDNSQAVFKDVPKNDPDFAAIQGLADAGFLPSSLTGDTSAALFRPDASLTREDLIAWKVALDTRKSLPTASLENLKETWGFQDAAKIAPKAMRSLYADYQNGDKANVGRVFGSTTLFQPKKKVTRAEAAAALWYFGYQDDGISARDALQINEKQPTQPNQ
jgi:hypothetical protein